MDKGIGQVADILVFALLISIAITALSAVVLVDLRVEVSLYASNLAQSTLLSFQYSTAEQFGGFEYQLGAFGFEANFPLAMESTRRDLRYKTLCQLIEETALLNLRVEVAGVAVPLLRPNMAMEGCLEVLLKRVLDLTVGGKFEYRLLVRTVPVDLGFVQLIFEMEISKLSGTKDQMCSETMALSLPTTEEELMEILRPFKSVPSVAFDPDPIIEVGLELWS